MDKTVTFTAEELFELKRVVSEALETNEEYISGCEVKYSNEYVRLLHHTSAVLSNIYNKIA